MVDLFKEIGFWGLIWRLSGLLILLVFLILALDMLCRSWYRRTGHGRFGSWVRGIVRSVPWEQLEAAELKRLQEPLRSMMAVPGRQKEADDYYRWVKGCIAVRGGDGLVTVAQELEMLELYIRWEHYCNNRSLVYKLEVEEGLDPTLFYTPLRLLQPVVEGLFNCRRWEKPDQGELSLVVSRNSKRKAALALEYTYRCGVPLPVVELAELAGVLDVLHRRLHWLNQRYATRSFGMELDLPNYTAKDQTAGTVIQVLLLLPDGSSRS